MKILYQGQHVATVGHPVSLEEALALLAQPDEQGRPTRQVDPAQVQLVPEAQPEVRQIVRRDIHAQAGDPESLLGTTADAAQIALVTLAELLSALETAPSLADVRAAVAGCTALAALKQMLADKQAGTCKMPYEVKGGAAAVMPEIERRATVVADAIATAPKA